MIGNIIIYLFIILLVGVIYYYYDELYIYIKPFFDKARNENMLKVKAEKAKRKKKEGEAKEGEAPEKMNIIAEIKEITNLPFHFLYKLCVTYGIFPIKKDSTTI